MAGGWWGGESEEEWRGQWPLAGFFVQHLDLGSEGRGIQPQASLGNHSSPELYPRPWAWLNLASLSCRQLGEDFPGLPET